MRNADYVVVREREVPQNRNILSDQEIVWAADKAKEKCPHTLRRIVVWDPVKERFHNDDEANSMLSGPQRFPYVMSQSNPAK